MHFLDRHVSAHLMDELDFPTHRFELYCLRQYLANAVGEPLRKQRRPSRSLGEWIDKHGKALGLGSFRLEVKDPFNGDRLSEAESRRIARALQPRLNKAAVPAASPLEIRLRWIASTLRLNAADAAILKLAVRAMLHAPVHSLADAAAEPRSGDEIGAEAIGLLLKQPKRAVWDRLRMNRPLMQFGLVEDRCGGDISPSVTVMRLARLRHSDPERLRRELFGKAQSASLTWADFDHLGEARDLTAKLVSVALERREPGIGILLYGAPGTGKTEFAKRLAQELGARAVFIGETDEENAEPSRSDRISHYALASTLAVQAGRTILVVDEADDIFTGVDEGDRASRTGSKVFINRMVERCGAPTLWITNAPERLGTAVMRRMALAIHFRQPGRDVRRRMVERLSRKRKLTLAPADLDRLAAIEAAPALIDAGLRTAALTGGGVAAALQGTATLLAALGQPLRPPAPRNPTAFDPALSAADCDLTLLAERVKAAFAAGETALSFCFHGLPGTGKSAYARHLAACLGIEVVEKRASDLLDMWVGSTEKHIAAAFAEAAERRAMLILDEADSLLLDRAGARQRWEVTQVNEMLTWMERHPHPFVCTTNAAAILDPATTRRFLFKVAFLPMTVAQAHETFRRTFGAKAPAVLDRIDPLTPGDFAVVARKARVLGEREVDALVAMLAAEVAAKPGAGRGRMGF